MSKADEAVLRTGIGSRETRDDEKPLRLAKLEKPDRPEALLVGFSKIEKLLRRLAEVLEAEVKLAELLAVPVSKVAARSIVCWKGLKRAVLLG